MLGLPSSFLLLSSSFLLAFSLLFFLFRGVFQISYVCVCWSREVERKVRGKTLLFLAFQRNSFFLFSCMLAENGSRGGRNGFCFFHSSKSCNNFQCSINAHHVSITIHVLSISSCHFLLAINSKVKNIGSKSPSTFPNLAGQGCACGAHIVAF